MNLIDDLSGAELRSRLEQRGVVPEEVSVLVAHRDRCRACRTEIEKVLKP